MFVSKVSSSRELLVTIGLDDELLVLHASQLAYSLIYGAG